MNLLLEFIIKISLVVALGLLAASVLHRRSAALRHWMLTASMAAALATPLLMQVAPAWRLPVSANVAPVDHVSGREPTSGRASRIGITTSVEAESRIVSSPTAFDPKATLLGIWFALQALPAVGQLATPDVSASGGGVAYFAHIGGFLFGLATVKLFARRAPERSPPAPPTPVEA